MEFQIAVRNFLKRPFLNSVKVIGLSLSLSGSMVILLFVLNQLSYDQFNINSKRIYRLTTTGAYRDTHFAKVFEPGFMPVMASYYPEIENYVRLVPVLGGVIKYNEQFLKIDEAFECDSTFFKVFDSVLLIGNSNNILNNPGSRDLGELCK